ncbi:MAG: hypothetical protein AAFV53_28865 [Myxococcota bacterium]
MTIIYTPRIAVVRLFGQTFGDVARNTHHDAHQKTLDVLASITGTKTADIDAVLSGEEQLTIAHRDFISDLAAFSGQHVNAFSYRTLGTIEKMEDGEMERADAPPDPDEVKTYPFTMSTADEDRAYDIVKQDFDVEDFNKNPIAPFGHMYSMPAVGRWSDVSVRDGVLKGDLEPMAYASYPLSMTVRDQLADGLLKTVSVGFLPREVKWRGGLKEDDPDYGRRGVVFIGNKLLECSVTPVPMNQAAVMDSKRFQATDSEPPHLTSESLNPFGALFNF